MFQKPCRKVVFIPFSLILFLAFGLGLPALGATYSFHPVVYSRAEGEPAPEAESHALWPFYSSFSTPRGSVKGFHPLWSWTVDYDRPMSDVDVLWPFAAWREQLDPKTSETLRRSMILPLWFSKTTRSAQDGLRRDRVLFPFYLSGLRRPPERPETSYQIVFPFWWRFNNQHIIFPLYWSNPADSFAVWPFYGRFLNLFGFDKIQFIAWPLWVTSRSGEARSYSPLWPVFNYTTGPSGVRGGRLWPLFGYYANKRGGNRAFWVWPLGQYARIQEGPLKGATLNMFLPFWFRLDHPKRQLAYYFPVYAYDRSPGKRDTRAWFWPLYARTFSEKPLYRKDSVLWLIWSRKTGPDVTDWKAFIFAGHRKEPGREQRYVLWPIGLYERDRKEERKCDFVRLFVVPFYASLEWRYDDGRTDKSRILWPFAFWSQKGTRREMSALRLFWYDRFEPIDRNWAPLWTFYTSVSDPAEGLSSRRIGGPLFWCLKDKKRDRSEANFLFVQYRRDGGQKWISLLGGLLPWRISHDGAMETKATK